jgi:hypothetical protein
LDYFAGCNCIVITIHYLPLHTTWKASKSIERYFKEMLEAGLGVAGNTEHVKALDDTISVASGMLEVAGDINEHAETIKVTLAGKAAKLN